ncbi:SH3 domain-containing protein [Ruegeria halocynthiae]|uniref:SH3 domain-containing protein n=1 Tax=Ruegeria halocynthiae TaxID=985054 RepID=A0A1H3D0C1_9RHOB|nr:SH3 domain-containing protein [Ruegeria halocynthiae]SDX59740.1 SH3 domain-containing protein [Ruegeria halocynthiae]
MSRVIIITFAMLGWSFYVMSGGPDFEPRGTRADQPLRVASVPEPRPAPIPASRAEDLVTNVAARAVSARVQPEPLAEDDAAVVLSQVTADPLSQFSAFDESGASFTLASLADGAAGLLQVEAEVQHDVTPTSQVVEPEKDIREISGTRVNMRDGPGTIYPIIAKAAIGQRVEVLSESGTGWLRLRLFPDQRVGWISASLVRKPTN